MSDVQNKLRQTAKELLEKGEVGYIIGWGEGRVKGQRPPIFIQNAEDADQLVWDEYCVSILGKYTLDDKYPEKKIGICVRGCDSRAINRQIQDNQIKRENVYLIGLPCEGKKNYKTDADATKCVECEHPNPVVYDVLLGDPVAEKEKPERFDRVKEIEKMSQDEKYAYFSNIFERCIRCYACRNVCPACNCRECYVDQYKVGWQGKQNNLAENQVYNLTRAYHISDRCIECGECERVCPMDLPLMELNRKLIYDLNNLFGPYESGMNLEDDPPLGTYKLEDPEEFM